MITQTKVDRELRNRGDAGLKSKEIRNAMLGQAKVRPCGKILSGGLEIK